MIVLDEFLINLLYYSVALNNYFCGLRSPVPPVQYTLEDIPEERIPEMEQITMDIDETRYERCR